ncbi:MAG: energy transducer TonB [Pseudomonadota bacterium]
MLKFFPLRSIASVVLLAAGIQTHAAAQALQNGPDFVRAGGDIGQINKSDSSYDPYVLSHGYVWKYNDPNLDRNLVFVADEPEREGLIDVRIRVKADGSVDEVELLGGFYDDAFRDQALSGMAAATFVPATAAGMPVDWPALEMRIVSRGSFLPALTATMKEDYERLLTLNGDKNFTDAEQLANELLARQARSLFDYALLQDQLATAYMNTDRVYAALIAERNATASSKGAPPALRGTSRLAEKDESYINDYLLPDLFVAGLRKKALLALALNQTGEALNTFTTLEARTTIAADDPLRLQIEAVQAKLAGEEPIGSPVKLVQGKWIFETSTRRVFGVTNLQGQVDFIDIACDDSVKKRMVFANDTEFGLPASWQNCKLEFHGTDGSTFNLYEYLN